MKNTFAVDWTTQPPPTSKAELQEALTQMFAELGQINIRIERHQSESDRLGSETRLMLDALNKNRQQGA